MHKLKKWKKVIKRRNANWKLKIILSIVKMSLKLMPFRMNFSEINVLELQIIFLMQISRMIRESLILTVNKLFVRFFYPVDASV